MNNTALEILNVHAALLDPLALCVCALSKGLETVGLVGSTEIPEQKNRLLAERNRLQSELQRCLQELHQRDVQFQQINSRVQNK